MSAAPGEDEDEPQDEGDDDAGEQHLLLVLPGHLEGGHHDDEDEEVIDAQRLLGDVTGQVLLGEAPPHTNQTMPPKTRAMAI